MVGEIRDELLTGYLYRHLDLNKTLLASTDGRAWRFEAWRIQTLLFSAAETYLVPVMFGVDIADLCDRRMARLKQAADENGWGGRATLFQASAVEVVLTPEALHVTGFEFIRQYCRRQSAAVPLSRDPASTMARWVGSGRRVNSADKALEALVGSGFDPAVEVLRESDAPTSPVPSSCWWFLTPESEIWRQEIKASFAGFVATAVPWHPDIVVRVDGRLVPVERVDYAFVGVEVGPGRHEVVISFAPRTVLFGGMISVVSIFIWSLVAITMWRSRGGRLFQSPTVSERARSPRSA